MLTDAHFHLDYFKEEERDKVVQRAKEAGVGLMHTVGINVETSRQAVQFAATFDSVYAGVGIQPWFASPLDGKTYRELRELARQRKVVSICEIGLDYTHNPDTKELQRDVFRQQIRLAKEVKLPIMVHNDNESQADVLELLKEEKAAEVGGAIHGFRGDENYAKECLALGFYLSFGRGLMRPNAGALLDVVKRVPNDRLLIETDAAGEEGGGPALVKAVAEKIAELRGLSVEEVGNTTSANLKRLFKI